MLSRARHPVCHRHRCRRTDSINRPYPHFIAAGGPDEDDLGSYPPCLEPFSDRTKNIVADSQRGPCSESRVAQENRVIGDQVEM